MNYELIATFAKLQTLRLQKGIDLHSYLQLQESRVIDHIRKWKEKES